MTMVHQHRTAVVAGLVSFVALAGVGLVSDFPDRPVDRGQDPTEALGVELLGESLLIFEIAGVTLLATMIGAIALASKRGRYGDAHAGSVAPDPPDSAPRGAPDPGADTLVDPRSAEHWVRKVDVSSEKRMGHPIYT